jgi:hypothetical protein
MRIAPELSLKNKVVAGGVVIAALMIAGCGKDSSSSGPEKLQPVQLNTKTAELPPTNTDNPSLNSINRFRKDILTQHQARIFLGDCVTWLNGDGFTVTLNPGVGSVKTPAGKNERYYVFEAPDQDTVTGLIEMNGPTLNNPHVFNTVMPTSSIGRPPEGIQRISLSAEPVVDAGNGQRYFEDTQTGLPVMDTALIPETYNIQQAAINACEALIQHRPVLGQVAQP